jgi:hypothetical protein
MCARVGAEGIRVEVHRKPGADRALIAAVATWRRGVLAALLALPVLLLVLWAGVKRVVDAVEADPGPELLAIVIALGITAVIIVRTVRRQARRPSLPGQRWCSPRALYPGPHEQALSRGGPADGAASLADSGPVPVVWLVLTTEQILIVPTQGEGPPLTFNLSDVDTIGINFGARRESGVSITGRDGRVAALLFQPDESLVRQLTRLGATVVTTDLTST